MARSFQELAFHPSIDEIVPRAASGELVIFTGGNNSGKSAYLKKAIEDQTKLYIGVNRFYSFHHLGVYNKNEREIHDWYQNIRNQNNSQFHNYEQSFFNCQTAICRLSNKRRYALFEKFEELFGHKAEVLAEDPENEFSNRFISIGGDSLSVTSSGTRLFLGILAALMDDRFSAVAIDEPELGLSPTLQRRLADIVIGGQGKAELFRHNPNIILSTHSHLFLDRETPGNNWVVTKDGNLISARRCTDFHELHDIQFRLLGNDLSQLFLPDAVVFVEGETDQLYLETIVKLCLPRLRAVVQSCSGDIAKRLSYWASTLGDMQLSPYRTRTLVVYDSVKQAGIERACTAAGLPESSRVEWGRNGIEYLYPENILRLIYRNPGLTAADLAVEADEVSNNGLTYKKMELCKKVCDALKPETALPHELTSKFLEPMSSL